MPPRLIWGDRKGGGRDNADPAPRQELAPLPACMSQEVPTRPCRFHVPSLPAAAPFLQSLSRPLGTGRFMAFQVLHPERAAASLSQKQMTRPSGGVPAWKR